MNPAAFAGDNGALTQYGSDAIAGVINIFLLSANHGGTVTANVGNYYDGGGFTAGGGADIGTSLGDDGCLHLGADYRHHNHSVRSGADSRTGVVDNLIFGDPEVERESIAFNAARPLPGNVAEVCSFATYAHRDGQSYENFRLPTVIPSVYPHGFSPQATIVENDFAGTVGIKGDQLLGWHWDLSSTYGGDQDGLGLINSGNPALGAATPTSFL